jgi:hypothetical protein
MMQKFEGIKCMYLFMLGWHHPSAGKKREEEWNKEDFLAKTAITATHNGCSNSLMELHAMGHVLLIELNRFEGQLSDWKFPTPWADYEIRTGLVPHTQKELMALLNELQQELKK